MSVTSWVCPNRKSSMSSSMPTKVVAPDNDPQAMEPDLKLRIIRTMADSWTLTPSIMSMFPMRRLSTSISNGISLDVKDGVMVVLPVVVVELCNLRL